jgi:hypothetical protein
MPKSRLSHDKSETIRMSSADTEWEIPLVSRASQTPSRRVLCGGDYHHRVRDTLVTVLDVEVRHGRATGRVVAVETTAAVRLPFVCHEQDLVVPAGSPAGLVGEAHVAAAARSRRGRRSR